MVLEDKEDFVELNMDGQGEFGQKRVVWEGEGQYWDPGDS